MRTVTTEVLQRKQELQQGITFLNDRVVPRVRAQAACALHSMAASLDRMAEALESRRSITRRSGERTAR